jgi:hypothetical protein
MKKWKLAALLMCVGVIGTHQLQAAMVTVDAADFATFTMDIDSDGTDDIRSLSQYSTTQVRVNITFDLYINNTLVPGDVAPGDSRASENFSDADVSGEGIWAGTWHAVSPPTRWNNVSSSMLITTDNIGLHWISGTKGTAGPISVIGMVVDTRNYNLLTSSGSVDLYYNYYGDFDAASGAQSLSLADTGFAAVPEPATAGLLAISSLILVGIRRIQKSYGIR